ncbi:2OG-Fe(II) oxygenase [Shewanella mangrovi]|uniref:2OG-Fe(II) oxygenase n=2 Tax=Shewanella mangrovi TaxID=1515746 RepID=A0A094JED7_9GAMM|nr:2OG-Fe(II) oxygenase [Shewanella mangrovi]
MPLFEDAPSQSQTDVPWQLLSGYLSSKQQQLLWQEAAHFPFSRPELTVFGKQHAIPRTQAWFADAGCDYLYSGLMIRALPWPHYLARLCQQLNQEFQLQLNGVLVNHYANGQEKMGWHSDDEPELMPQSTIASVSLGAARDFDIRHKQSGEKHRIALAAGDLLLMRWPMQRDWQHALPSRAKITDARLNFTFRQIVPFYHQP